MRQLIKIVPRYAFGFVSAVSIYFVFLTFYWQFYPYKTANVEVPIEVLNIDNKIKPGEMLNMILVFDKATDVTPVISRNITCDSGNNYEVEAPNGGRGRPIGKFFTEVNFRLSDSAVPGEKCVFTFQNDYQMNPIRVIRKTWISEPFTVTK